MKRQPWLRRLTCAVLVTGVLLSGMVWGHASDQMDSLTAHLQSGEYKLVVDDFRNWIFKLWFWEVWNFSVDDSPLATITIDESLEDTVRLTGHEETLRHLNLLIDEERKTIRVQPKNPILWIFPSKSLNITLGVPVNYVNIVGVGDDVQLNYKEATPTDFMIETRGKVWSYVTFAKNLRRLWVDVDAGGHAIFNGGAFTSPDHPIIVDDVHMVTSALSTAFMWTDTDKVDYYWRQVWGREVPEHKYWSLLAKKVSQVAVSGGSWAGVAVEPGAWIDGKVEGNSELWYDWDRRLSTAPPDLHVFVGSQGKCTKRFTVDIIT